MRVETIPDEFFCPDTPEMVQLAARNSYGLSFYTITEAQLDRLRHGQLLTLWDGEYVNLVRLVADPSAATSA